MARHGPPPLPPRPILQGGRRRSPLPRLIAIVAIVAAPIGVAAAALLTFTDSRGGGAAAPPLAVGAPPVAEAPAAPREPAPLIEGEPTPAVPLSGVDAFHLRLRRPPVAGLVFDVDTGDVLWRHRPLLVVPMASLTKIMTALLTVERSHPGDPVRITGAALRYTGSGIGLLPRGRRVRLETLLNGLLIVSGNDAAIALAVHLAGSERRFVAMMNRRARTGGSSARISRRRTGSRTATAPARATSACSPGSRWPSRASGGSRAVARWTSASRSRAGGSTSTATTR